MCGKPIHRANKNFCSIEHYYIYDYNEYISKWKQGIESGTTKGGYLNNRIKRYILNKYDNKCHKCGWNKTNPVTGKIPVEINHIDGNHKNNREKNLELLCPNCHSLTNNYGSLNNGMGRKNRHKKKST